MGSLLNKAVESDLILTAVGAHICRMAQSLSAPPLTREEFVSLRDGAKGLMHRMPKEHKAKLIELGYIEEISGGLRLTSYGRMRINDRQTPKTPARPGPARQAH